MSKYQTKNEFISKFQEWNEMLAPIWDFVVEISEASWNDINYNNNDFNDCEFNVLLL